MRSNLHKELINALFKGSWDSAQPPYLHKRFKSTRLSWFVYFKCRCLGSSLYLFFFHMFLHETRPTYKSAALQMFLEDATIDAFRTRSYAHTAGLINYKQRHLGGVKKKVSWQWIQKNCTQFTWISFHQILIGHKQRHPWKGHLQCN